MKPVDPTYTKSILLYAEMIVELSKELNQLIEQQGPNSGRAQIIINKIHQLSKYLNNLHAAQSEIA